MTDNLIKTYNEETVGELTQLINIFNKLPSDKQSLFTNNITNIIEEYKKIKEMIYEVKMDMLATDQKIYSSSANNGNLQLNITDVQKNELRQYKTYKKMMNECFPHIIAWWFSNNMDLNEV